MWRPAFLFADSQQEKEKADSNKEPASTFDIGRPNFLFPELQIPLEPEAAEEDAAPVGEAGGGDGEFQLEFESDEEWESEEDIKFDLTGKGESPAQKKRSGAQSWMNSASSISACSTISLEDALKDSEDFQGDSGDLDFDMGDRWKTALKESLDQPIFVDFERNVRKEAIRKLSKKNRKRLGKKKENSGGGLERRDGLERSNSEPKLFPPRGLERRKSESDVFAA